MAARLGFLYDPHLKAVLAGLGDAGFEALVVGGAARDGLMGADPKDIDVATNARPDDVARILGERGADMRPTGLDHGTWTAVVGGSAFEITTYRRDVSTDGRRATVAFADSFAEDAQRRDFTINALGIAADGTVQDPTREGLRDLDARKVRFVGDGATRCAEDSLRALRLFRFQGRMGSWPMDPDALEAAKGADLSHLSGERVWSEVKGILASKDGHKAAAAMAETGVWGRLLPRTPLHLDALHRVAAREEAEGLAPSWAARLCALTGRDKMPWPMSSNEARRLMLLSRHADLAGRPAAAAAASGRGDVGTDLWALGTTPAPLEGASAAAYGSADAKVPVTAADLMAQGYTAGPELGKRLNALRAAWIESDLRLGAKDLLATTPAAAPAARTPRTSHEREA